MHAVDELMNRLVLNFENRQGAGGVVNYTKDCLEINFQILKNILPAAPRTIGIVTITRSCLRLNNTNLQNE